MAIKITEGFEDIVEIYQGDGLDRTCITFRPKSTEDIKELMDLIKKLSRGKVWFTFKIKLGIGEE